MRSRVSATSAVPRSSKVLWPVAMSRVRERGRPPPAAAGTKADAVRTDARRPAHVERVDLVVERRVEHLASQPWKIDVAMESLHFAPRWPRPRPPRLALQRQAITGGAVARRSTWGRSRGQRRSRCELGGVAHSISSRAIACARKGGSARHGVVRVGLDRLHVVDGDAGAEGPQPLGDARRKPRSNSQPRHTRVVEGVAVVEGDAGLVRLADSSHGRIAPRVACGTRSGGRLPSTRPRRCPAPQGCVPVSIVGDQKPPPRGSGTLAWLVYSRVAVDAITQFCAPTPNARTAVGPQRRCGRRRR